MVSFWISSVLYQSSSPCVWTVFSVWQKVWMALFCPFHSADNTHVQLRHGWFCLAVTNRALSSAIYFHSACVHLAAFQLAHLLQQPPVLFECLMISLGAPVSCHSFFSLQLKHLQLLYTSVFATVVQTKFNWNMSGRHLSTHRIFCLCVYQSLE